MTNSELWLSRSWSVVLCLGLVMAPSVYCQSANQDASPWDGYDSCRDTQASGPPAPLCSSEITNGNCTIVVDRLNAVAPPTIFVLPMKTTAVVKVWVYRTSPFEILTLDWKSSTEVVPPDVFQSGFSNIAGVLGKLSTGGIASGVSSQVAKAAAPPVSKPLDEILKEQKDLQGAISRNVASAEGNSQDAIAQLQLILQAPPIIDCTQAVGSSQDQMGAFDNPWRETGKWIREMTSNLDGVTGEVTRAAQEDLQPVLNRIADDVATAAADPANKEKQGQIAELTNNQTILGSQLAAYGQLGQRLQNISDALKALKPPESQLTFSISDPEPLGLNYRLVTYTLNFHNVLSPLAAQIAGSQVMDQFSAVLGSLPAGPTKTAIETLSVQFQAPPRWEIFTGIMAPGFPYHSYQVAPQASNATVTSYSVQETKTYTIIPTASINFRPSREKVVWGHRGAVYISGMIGYNPSTSAIEFGAGPSISWRSIVLSGLLDIRQDTHLTGGFVRGSPLGSTPPTTLPTAIAWHVAPAAGLSVRIPLTAGSP